MEITSVNNDLVKNTVKLQQKKYRNIEKKFLLEGFKAIKEAFDSGIILEHVFVDKNKIKEYEFCKDILIEASEPVLKKISTTDSTPEAVAIGVQKIFDIKDLKNVQKVVLLEDIKDSGNLGTILRSAVAFGVDAVVLFGDCVDIYNPKTVRASVGNLWKLPIVQIKDVETFNKIFKDFNKIATLPRSKNLLKTYKINLPAVVMFGSEADGLTDKLIKLSNDSVKIEMSPKVESLNLATSVSVILYELF
mgnify:FL=1